MSIRHSIDIFGVKDSASRSQFAYKTQGVHIWAILLSLFLLLIGGGYVRAAHTHTPHTVTHTTHNWLLTISGWRGEWAAGDINNGMDSKSGESMN